MIQKILLGGCLLASMAHIPCLEANEQQRTSEKKKKKVSKKKKHQNSQKKYKKSIKPVLYMASGALIYLISLKRGQQNLTDQTRQEFFNLYTQAEPSEAKALIYVKTYDRIQLEKNSSGETALHYAAQWNHQEVVQALLQKGALVNAKDNKGKTPLDLAAESTSLESAEYLISKGANIEDGSYKKLAGLAKKESHKLMQDYLISLKQGQQNLTDQIRQEFFGLYTQAEPSEAKALIYVKTYDRIQLEQNLFGETALHYAAEWNHQEVVQALFQKGALVNAKDSNTETPLHYAAKWGNQDVVLFLLNQKNIDVEATDYNGATPLHYAAEWGHQEIVQALLQKGADMDAVDNNGQNSVLLAAGWGHQEVVTFLKNYPKSSLSHPEKITSQKHPLL